MTTRTDRPRSFAFTGTVTGRWAGKAAMGDFGAMARNTAPKTALGALSDTASRTIGDLKWRFYWLDPFPFTGQDIMRLCFDPNDVDLLTRAKGLSSETVESKHWNIFDGAALTMNTSKFGCFPPRDCILQPGAHRIAEWIHTYRENVSEPWAVVAHVVAWLNRHATPGAFVYYFPQIKALCPVEWGVTPRFREPANIGPLLPLIRRAAATVATGLLLPDAPLVVGRSTLFILSQDIHVDDVYLTDPGGEIHFD